MNLQGIKNRFFRRLKKIIAYTILFVVAFFTLSFITLQIPAVQENLITRYLKTFNKVTGFNANLESFNLTWYDRLEIYGLSIKDPENNTMIRARRLKVNFVFHSLLKKNDVNIDAVELDSAQVSLITIPDSDSSTDLNINIFIDRLNKMLSSGKGGGSNPKVNIGEIVINNALFHYNERKLTDSTTQGFNYRHFTLSIPDAQAQNFKIIGDTTQFNVLDLQAVDENTRLKIDQLQTFFRISQNSMEFLGLHLKVGKSTINDTIVFKYKSQRDLSDFVNKVSLKAHLTNTLIHPEDLLLFAPEVSMLKHPLHLEGMLTGKVSKLYYKNMSVGYNNTSLHGSLQMDGLPVLKETFINLKLSKSKINIRDFAFVIPQ